ncbi:MAG TPA: DUF4142 domain-containing protein [Tepidisphaeraceae bacterium]|nr:DUF4142 domain-containing protein [Tepidisphaeraceae bacterium]
MRSKHLSLLASVAVTALASAAFAGTSPQQISKQDQQFLDRAWNVNTTEIRLGDVAEHKGTNADVKAFGQRMVADHTKLNKELTTLAKQYDAVLPKALNTHHQQLVDKLSKMSGSDFDKEYMTDMIGGHEKAVAAFQKESQDHAQTAVDKWAGQALPTLKDHLQLAEKTGKEVGASMPSQSTAIPAAHQEHPSGK